ncbi:PEP/pyruvate-binding domain-containing protein [Deltaproteobacteria bacterium TL4]
MTSKYVLPSQEAFQCDKELLGEKASYLAWLTRNAFPVPEWVVLTTSAFDLHLKQAGGKKWIEEQMRDLPSDSAECSKRLQDLRGKIILQDLPLIVSRELQKQLEALTPINHNSFAIRSSVVGEESKTLSFAGQLDSFLFQKELPDIAVAIRRCYASAFSDRVIQYRILHHLPLDSIEMAVIVQVMVEGEMSGVMCTANPHNGSRKQAVVSAGYGMGTGIMSGASDADEYIIDLHDRNVVSCLREKKTQMVFDQEQGKGVKACDVGDLLSNRPCLTEEEVRLLVMRGKNLAELMGAPQNIEWTFARKELYILQTRPITQLPYYQAYEEDQVVWDNLRIQESFCGVTTPLTYSFAKLAYAKVYRQLMLKLGLGKKHDSEFEPVLQHLLGLIQGRIYSGL